MATYGNNVTLKVSAAVSNQITAASGTLYTAAANSYAVVNIAHTYLAGSSTATITVAGRNICQITAGSNTQPSNNNITVYVGPSQAVAFSGANGAATTYISGVEFINTP